MQIFTNISLKSMNTFGIDANARYFATVQTVEEFKIVLSTPSVQPIAKLILGEGSNILFTQDYQGLVIKNSIQGIDVIEENADHVWLKVGAGENWHELVMFCVQQGYAGIENLSLIPGKVGAAPIQNIGAYGVELKDTFLQLEAIHLQSGAIQTFDNESCQFGYRDSIFKTKYKNQFAILSIVLRLNKKLNLNLEYGAIKDTLQRMQVKTPTLKNVSDAVIQIRRSKLPDPKQLGNAGSFFKNPIISHEQFIKLQQSFPDMPFFSIENSDDKKIPAAWLIEQCGWKGKRFGDFGVYEKQALILVNYGNATGNDIKELSEKIQQSVQQQFGIFLFPEVNLI